jgi:hypothetical protein
MKIDDNIGIIRSKMKIDDNIGMIDNLIILSFKM